MSNTTSRLALVIVSLLTILSSLLCGGQSPPPAQPLPVLWRMPVHRLLLPISQPVIAADTLVYLGMRSGAGSQDVPNLVAHDAATGEQLWTVHLSSWRSDGGPLAAAGSLVFTYEHEPAASINPGRAFTLIAFDVRTGQRAWHYDLGETGERFPGRAEIQPVRVFYRAHAGPAADEARVYVEGGYGGQRSLIALDVATGELVWDYGFDGQLASRPVVAGEYVAALRQTGADEAAASALFVLEAATGRLVWETPLEGPAAHSALGGGGDALYLLDVAGQVSALRVADGAGLWTSAIDPIPALPAGESTQLFPPTPSGDSLFLAGFDARVYALDAATGVQRWASPVDARPNSRVAAGSGLAVVGTTSGYLTAFNAETGRQAWSVLSPRTAIQGGGDYLPPQEIAPAITADTLYYFAGTNWLLALRLRR